MSNKVVYSACFGGFMLSQEARLWLQKRGCHDPRGLSRHDPLLVACVEALGAEASARNSRLRVAEIEGDVYRIDEYDGYEAVQVPSDIDWVHIKGE